MFNNSRRWQFAAVFSIGVGMLGLLFFLAPIARASVAQPTLDLVYLTNQARLDNHLQALAVNQKLTVAAKQKAEDMFAKNYFDHDTPDGKKPWDFIEASGYPYIFAGENLAINYGDVKTEFEAWMNSPTHRENILFPDYQEIGISTLSASRDGKMTTVTVQLFGSRDDFIAPRASLINAEANSKRSETLVEANYLNPEENSGYVASAAAILRDRPAFQTAPKSPVLLASILTGYFLIVVGLLAFFTERRLFIQFVKRIATIVAMIAAIIVIS